jgi:hypothetical protein
MAIRNDISVDFSVSPRVAIIDAPSTEVTIQDLHDTLRSIESSSQGIVYSPLISSAGKETLDATTKVGLTSTLLNIKVGFEARADWTQCSISGGNLVAVDANGDSMNPIYPTAFVNVDRTSSSSGTLQEQDALQYASYGGVISVKISSPYSGTAYPVGNKEYPVNNIQDAVSIAHEKGFDTLSIIGSVTLTAGDDVTDFKILGTNPMTSAIHIEPEAICNNVYVMEMTFSGTLDGGSLIRNCLIANPVYYFNGFLEYCALASNANIYINGAGNMMNCRSVGYPSIHMDDGDTLFISNYDGDLHLRGQTNPASLTHIVSNGEIIIDSSCTAGKIEIHGDVQVTNNGSVDVFEDQSTGTPTEIADAVWEKQLT